MYGKPEQIPSKRINRQTVSEEMQRPAKIRFLIIFGIMPCTIDDTSAYPRRHCQGYRSPIYQRKLNLHEGVVLPYHLLISSSVSTQRRYGRNYVAFTPDNHMFSFRCSYADFSWPINQENQRNTPFNWLSCLPAQDAALSAYKVFS